MLEPNLVNVVLILTAILISCAIWSRLRKPLEYRQISSHVPSLTKNLWNEMLFSCTMGMKHPKDLLPFFKEIFEKNGPVVHANITGRSYVLLNDPDDIKTLLSSTAYINKGPEYEMLKPWLNDGLLLSKGSKWHNRRKLLTNTFHFKTLDMYNPAVNKHARVFAKNLLDACADNKEISISEYVTLCSLDIICETIMGTEMNAQKGKSVQYVHSIKSACRSVIDRVFKFWLWNDLIYRISNSGRSFFTSIKVLHEFTDNVIKRKQLLLKNSENQKVQPEIKPEKNRPKSFLDLLLDVLNENPDQMTIKDIREEVDTFLFEGHDTSSIAITMTILLLGLHQDIQDHAREELYSIFGDSDRDATMDDLNAMRYLDAVIKETLRLYPSVPSFTRELNTTLQLKNYTIPPMTTMAIFPYVLHRNENIYPKPEEFIPERYIPFSAGARNCIGQKYAMNQMKTVISTVLRNARIVSSGCKEDIKISMQLLIRIESLPKNDEDKNISMTNYPKNVTEMIELNNLYGVVLIFLVGLISYAIWSRLRMPLEYRQISSHVPSATKTFWSEIQLSWKMAMFQPKDILPFLLELTRSYGSVVHFNFSSRSYVLINNKDDLKILLSSTQYIKKGPEYDMLRPWLNDGLLLSSGQKWQNRRKLLTNTFHFKTLGMYNISINKHSRKLVDKLLNVSANGNQEISIFDYITLCSLDMINNNGYRDECSRSYLSTFKYYINYRPFIFFLSACKSVIERVFKVWLWNDFIYRISKSGQRFFESINVLHEFTDNVIKHKRALLNRTIIEKVQSDSTFEKPQKKSFLDLLLNVLNDNPDQMNDKDIREEVDTFLFEGHDTSSISMTMTLVLLGIYQDIQDRARDELFDIFGDSDRDATMEDLNSMQYLEAIIKESLRLYPSVPGFSRVLETPLSINNYTIPPKTVVIVYPYVLHRNEDIYSNAEEFKPERFLEEKNKEKFHFGYIPFSAGARNCIGQKYAMNQMKTINHYLLDFMKKDNCDSLEIVLNLERNNKYTY
ncbi:hypothetical protein AGLY_003684 [Aphis glycines]|uniref:Cytochrome P450 n=1 Tax=Aphis glycines TaxID=307491 RepID=A0A6G0TYZ0_APHGL|nr:hypothetical protein AGLY_003684 [Aphis glycines]